MTDEQLATALRDAVARAPDRKKVVVIHLFGIRHGKYLKGRNTKAIAGLAGIPETYGTELSKGANLAPYVSITSEP